MIDIAAGANHVIALNSVGNIFSWGTGEQFQLGRRVSPRIPATALTPSGVNFLSRRAKKSSRESSPESRKAPKTNSTLSPSKAVFNPTSLAENKFSDVYAGDHHSFAITTAGVVYAFGLNNYHQLGGGESEHVIEPVYVEELSYPIGKSKDRVSYIAGAEHHTLVCTEQGKVFVFGRSDSKQLGLGRPQDTQVGAYEATPTLLSSLGNIHLVAAGGQWSAAVSKSGELYTWGYGDAGQLATGEDHDEETPFQVKLNTRKVLSIGCGGQHLVLLLSDRAAKPPSQ